MPRYELFPEAADAWYVQLDGERVGKKHATRSEALKAARDHRGDQRPELFDAEGNSFGEVELSRGPEAIVLLRMDGSMYGEIDHEVREGGTPQVVSITPVGEASEASE